MSRIISVIRSEPATVMYAVNAVLAAVVAFGVKASPDQVGAVATIAAGLITIVTAITTRPVAVPVITGAVATIATAAGAFGLHLSAQQIGTAVPVLSIVLALVLRQAVTPVASLRARPPG